MKKYFMAGLLGWVSLIACGKKGGEISRSEKADSNYTSHIKIDSLVFEVDTFHVTEKETNCMEAECTYCDLYYERIKTPLMPVHDSVNLYIDSLMMRALNEIASKEWGYDLKKRAKEFIETSKSPEFGETGTWDWEHHTSIFRPVNEIITVSSGWGGYTGGVHGSYYMETVNFFTNTGKRVRLQDVFTDLDALNKIGIRYFKKDNKLKPDEDIIDQGWDFEDKDFALNENFDVTTKSVTWQFNSYEIGPYSAGAPLVTIPIKDLDKIMKVKFTDVKIE